MSLMNCILKFKVLKIGVFLIVCGLMLDPLIPSKVLASTSDHSDNNVEPTIKIGLTLSGGGIRAASFAYGVMLELGKITLCGRTKINDETKRKDIVEIKEVIHNELSKSKECVNGTEPLPFLDHVHFISAVSGGTITSSYFMTHSDRNFQRQFRKLLKKKKFGFNKMTTELFLRMKTKGDLPLSPLLLLSSAIDTVKDLITLPFFWLPDGFPLANPNLTPGVFLFGARGLIHPEELADVYEDWFKGKNKTFNHAQKQRPNTELLINATDVKNHRAFTFDERTFSCLGVPPENYKKFRIALAAAASSALPILFTPLELEGHIEKLVKQGTRPSDCSHYLPIYHSKENIPELLDGGISENLGIGGLIKRIFYLKNQKKKGFNHKTKTFFLVANSAALNQSSLPSIGDKTTISQNVDQSLETLMRDKTGLARTIFTGPLNNFGFSMVHLNFAGIEENAPFVKKILDLKLSGENIMEDISKSLEMEKTIVNELQTIGMTATPDQIDTLIAAGRAIVQYRFGRIANDLKTLSQKEWPQKEGKLNEEGVEYEECEDIVNPSKYYCWHKNFQNKGLLERPLQTILKTFSLTTDDFLTKTTVNRVKGFEKLQKSILENRQNWERVDSGLRTFTKKRLEYIKTLVASDAAYQELIGNLDKVNPLNALSYEIDNFWAMEKIHGFAQDTKQRKKSHEFWKSTLENISNGRPIHNNCLTNKDGGFGVCERPRRVLSKYVFDASPDEFPFLKRVSWSYWFASKLHYVLEQKNLSFHYLYQGIKEHPFDMNLYAILGEYSILLEENFTGGLAHLSQALNLADVNSRQAKTLAQFRNSPKADKLPARFDNASRLYSTMYALYSGIDPIPIQKLHNIVLDKGYQYAQKAYENFQNVRKYHIEGDGKDGNGTKDPLNREDWEKIKKLNVYPFYTLYNYGLQKIRAFSHIACPAEGDNSEKGRQRKDEIANAINLLEIAKHHKTRKIVRDLTNKEGNDSLVRERGQLFSRGYIDLLFQNA